MLLLGALATGALTVEETALDRQTGVQRAAAVLGSVLVVSVVLLCVASRLSRVSVRLATSRSSSRVPSAAEAPAGSPSTPLGLTFLTPCARSSGSSSAIGRVSPAAARSRSTSDGARASISDVSVRPACASPAARTQPRVPHVTLPPLGPQPGDRVGDRRAIPAVSVDQQHRWPVQAGVPAELDKHQRQGGPCRSTACRGSPRARRSPRSRPAARAPHRPALHRRAPRQSRRSACRCPSAGAARAARETRAAPRAAAAALPRPPASGRC